MNTSRRQFLSRSTFLGTSLALQACTPRSASTPPPPAPSPPAPRSDAATGAAAPAEGLAAKADYELRIGTGLVELADDHIASTTLYNGQFPGPLYASSKDNALPSTFTTIPTHRSSCTGMGK